MTSPDTPAERALVALAVERQQARIDRAAAEMAASLDAYRDDFTTRHAELLRGHQDRVREIEEQGRAFLTSYYDNGDEGTQDVQQVPQDASSPGAPASPGPGPAGHPSAWDAELAEAERIKNMSMGEYAARRAEFGVRSPTDMNRLFGEQR